MFIKVQVVTLINQCSCQSCQGKEDSRLCLYWGRRWYIEYCNRGILVTTQVLLTVVQISTDLVACHFSVDMIKHLDRKQIMEDRFNCVDTAMEECMWRLPGRERPAASCSCGHRSSTMKGHLFNRKAVHRKQHGVRHSPNTLAVTYFLKAAPPRTPSNTTPCQGAGFQIPGPRRGIESSTPSRNAMCLKLFLEQ